MKCTAVVLFIVFLLFFMLMLFEMNLGNSDSIINNRAVCVILGNITLLYFARVNLGKSKVFGIKCKFPVLLNTCLRF